MGADTKRLRNRIKSVDSTLHLTKAMGLVASSKIRRTTAAMLKCREYSESISSVIRCLSSSPGCQKSPYMQERDGGETRLVVIAGDRGLAGGYNANIFRTVRDGYTDATIIPIGKRSCDRYGSAQISAEAFTYADAYELSAALCSDFANGGYDRLGVLWTEYISLMTQIPRITWLLPLQKTENGGTYDVVFEPDELTVLNAAVTEYVAGKLIAAVRESFACEIAARRIAMDSAGKNAQLMIDELTLQYNRARQSAITQEITEIVAGSGQ